MDVDELHLQCHDLERILGWTDADRRRVASLGKRIASRAEDLIDGFERLIERPAGGGATTGRSAPDPLRAALRAWLSGLCDAAGDRDHATRCGRLGAACFETGLAPAIADLALLRLCSAIRSAVAREDHERPPAAVLESLDKRLDLDLAIVAGAHRQGCGRLLQQAEREATIQQIIGGVAHELRQPLNILRTSAYYLRNAGDPEAAKAEEHLERMERQVALADRVIRAMSAFAKLPAPAVSAVSIAHVLAAALEANPLASDIEVTIACPEDLAPVPADSDQLQIALGNLIRNARDAMPEGGRLSLAVRGDDERVEIAVADTGKGIPASELGRITDPLYTTKARGMGLGLAITRAIVENHGGSIRAESEPGMGAAFTVTLPRVAATETTDRRA
jgi:signal transduction histidine kinase